MNRIFTALLALVLLALTPHTLLAQSVVTIGVHVSDSPRLQGYSWQQLTESLSEMMHDHKIVIVELKHDEIEQALEHHRLDFLLADPAVYVQLKELNALTQAVATVRGVYQGKPVFSQAGTIITRHDRADIATLQDLRGKRVAIEGQGHLSTYQAQAHMLFEAGMDPVADLNLIMYGDDDEAMLLDRVLQGVDDAAFIRAGLLEELVGLGHVKWADIQVLNKQDLPGFPYAVSTRLYPERSLVVLSHVAPRLAQQMVTAFYRLKANTPALTAVGMFHITLPEDYSSVAEVARDLRLPPFDVVPALTIGDIWQRYTVWIVVLISVVVFISLLATTLIFANRRLQREIEARRKTEESLKSSEHDLAESQKLVHLGNWAFDMVDKQLSWSREVYRIFEIDPQNYEPSYELFLDAIHPKDRQLVDDAFSQSVESGKPYSVEHRLLFSDERIKYVHERGEYLYGDDGTPLSVVGTVLDITERKLVELQVEEANERFELAMQASNDGLWDWDVVTDQVYYSPRWKTMLGYREDELEDDFSTWEALIDEQDSHIVMQQIQHCLAGEQDGFEAEFRMRHKEGHWVDLLSRGIAKRNDSGEVIRFAGTHVDITERKEMERSLREQERELNSIIDQLPSILFVKDAKELKYVRFNRSGEEKMGLPPGYFIGKDDYEVFPKELADQFSRDDRRALNSPNAVDISEEVIDTPAGKRIMHTRKVTIHDENGEAKYLLGIFDDITEKKEAEEEQERLQRELQQAQKMESLGQLTGGIAHDFNNLLGIINGYSGLALNSCKKTGEDKLAGYMRHLIEASDRATNLVSQMLAFSRSDQVEDAPIQFAPLLKKDIEMIRSTLPSTIDMKSEIEPGLPSVVMNPTQLHQILMNLSINARDAMNGVGKLNIKLGWARGLDTEATISHKPVKGDWIELRVSDTGSGIDAETAQKVFNPFFTTKEIGKGTGMGLSVIYGIMENHEGHIMLDSVPGEGSAFRMLFPPHLESDEVDRSHSGEQQELPEGDGSEVLVVDDEPSLGIFMAELLKSHGYQATALSDSLEAVELFRQEPDRFSMLITDQTMPNMTGIELITELRAMRSKLPAILCTGYSDKIDAKGAAELDIPFFAKPIDEMKLVIKIADVLASKK